MASKGERELREIAGREVAISSPSKVLFRAAGYTKRDLVDYYLSVSEGALRGAGGRPNVLVRYPLQHVDASQRPPQEPLDPSDPP